MTELEHRELVSIIMLFYREVEAESKTPAWNIERYRERAAELQQIFDACHADASIRRHLGGCFATNYCRPPLPPVDKEVQEARKQFPWLETKTRPIREPSMMDLFNKPEIELILRLRAINHMIRMGWPKDLAIKTFAIPGHPFFRETSERSAVDHWGGSANQHDGGSKRGEDVPAALQRRKRKLN